MKYPYVFKLSRSSICEYGDVGVIEFDPIVNTLRTAKKNFMVDIFIKVKNPEKSNRFYDFGIVSLYFHAFENPSSYILRINPGVPGFIAEHEQAPQIVQDDVWDVFKELFIDDLEFHHDNILYMPRKSDMTKEDFTEVAELLTNELNERLSGYFKPLSSKN